jgi:glycogen(starch) synthase
MRILFWSETFWPRIGGVENLAARLLLALRVHGYEFVVVTWANTKVPDEIRYQDIPVRRFPFFSGGHRDGLRSMIENRREVARLKQQFAPDLVHINSYGRSVLYHLNTTSAHPAPVLVTLHQALPDEPVARDSLLGHLLRTADWVTGCSNAVLAHTRQLVPEVIPCSSVIHNALERPPFDPQPISFDPPRILCLGRLVADKGFDLALTALATVLDRFPNARLVIAGEGSERERLWQQMIHLNLAKSVEFIGNVPPENVARLIDAATLVVVPSRLEGFGLVALEAALMARPVVATRTGGLVEVVVHRQTGLLIEGDNSAALAQAIVLLLEHPPLATQMGHAARDRAQKEFNWRRHVDAYDALYRRLGLLEQRAFLE